MKTFASCIVLVLAIGGLVCLSCKQILPNHNPVIAALNAPASVNAGGSTSVSCTASDPDGDDLTYNWTCTTGSLSSSSGASVTWTAPVVSGSATVTVAVHDSRGGSDTRSKTMTVSPVTTTIIDWDGAVQAGYYTYWNLYIESGYSISGSFSVDAHDITFLVLDASNYANWCNNQSYSYEVRVERSAGTSFSASISTNGTYYFVLDNTYSIYTDKFAHLFVQKTSP